MRPRPPWMSETDDAILEFYESLAEAGFRVALPPTVVWANLTKELQIIDRSRNTISNRMRRLTKAELLEVTDEKRRYYRITDKGLAYLNDELEYADLQLRTD